MPLDLVNGGGPRALEVVASAGVLAVVACADAAAPAAALAPQLSPITTFTAATEGTDIDVRFRFEYRPYPDVDPSFETAVLTISGTTPKEYSVNIPIQGSVNTYSSALFFLNTRDQKLTAYNFKITKN